MSAGELANPYNSEHFDRAAIQLTKEEIEQKTNLLTSFNKLFETIRIPENMNISGMVLHNICPDHKEFIKAIARYPAAIMHEH